MVDDKTLPTPRPDERQVIQAYGPGRFRISNAVYEHAVLVLPDRTLRWNVSGPLDIQQESLVGLPRDGSVEILLIGCGRQAVPLPPGLRPHLREAGIVVDVMDTGAACRTYGVLLAEGRRVAAALIAMPVGQE